MQQLIQIVPSVRRHMKVIARVVLLAALAVVAAPLSWAQSDIRYQTCPREIGRAFASALQYGLGDVPDSYAAERFDLKSPTIPDYGILRSNGVIYIRDYLDDPQCTFDESALPRSANVAFTLVDETQIRELARDEGGLAYVQAAEIHFREDEVEIRLGVAFRQRPGDERGLLCCCGGAMILRQIAGNWVFEEWRNVFCA
jgi:hypothetical protein